MNAHSTQLWPFALALYAQEGVAKACLTLQDEYGADICELLWLCWLDRLGLTVDAGVDEALAPLRRHQAPLVRALRERRRALKTRAQADALLAGWRQAIKDAEFAAERDSLAQLQALAERGEGVRPLRRDDAPLPERLAAQGGCHYPQAATHLCVLVAQCHRLPDVIDC